MSISKIDPKLHHMIDEVIVADDAIGVYLKRPYVFSVTNSLLTFFDLDDCEADGLDPWSALNECIADEAIAIDPKEWDKG
jgi:hypothetical protein